MSSFGLAARSGVSVSAAATRRSTKAAFKTVAPCARRKSLVCRAQQEPLVPVEITSMLKRYDFVSTGMGALCVTGYFWARGQDVGTALSIAAFSTVVALVANELFFTENSK